MFKTYVILHLERMQINYDEVHTFAHTENQHMITEIRFQELRIVQNCSLDKNWRQN